MVSLYICKYGNKFGIVFTRILVMNEYVEQVGLSGGKEEREEYDVNGSNRYFKTFRKSW